MTSIAFLSSGGGGNLKFFHSAAIEGIFDDVTLSVIADRECGASDFARRNGIGCRLISYDRSNSVALNNALEEIAPDVIITNWHKIIDGATVARYAGRLVNLHYSLLPAFGGLIGLEPIRRAYEQGCRFIGATCHLVDEGVDTGKILSQSVFSTEREYNEAVTLMFRRGCLTLTSGVEKVIGRTLACNRKNVAYDECFSPQLGFDASVFSDRFWKDLSET